MATEAELTAKFADLADRAKKIHEARNQLLKDFRLGLKECEGLEGLVEEDRGDYDDALNPDHPITSSIESIAYTLEGHVGPGYYRGVENNWSEPLEFWVPSYC